MKNKFDVCGSITKIYLSRGQITVIDTEDLPLVQAYPGTWHAHYSNDTKSYYVDGNAYDTGKQRTIRLHRLLFGEPKKRVVDHINRDTLDNRRSCNLRVATYAENTQNKNLCVATKSGVRGVTWNVRNRKWQLRMTVNGRRTSLGLFNTLAEAEGVAKQKRSELLPFSQEARNGGANVDEAFIYG